MDILLVDAVPPGLSLVSGVRQDGANKSGKDKYIKTFRSCTIHTIHSRKSMSAGAGRSDAAFDDSDSH